MKNSSTAQNHFGINVEDNVISYRFKPEFVVCDNNSNNNTNANNINNSEYALKNKEDIILITLEKCKNKYEDLFLNTIINEYIEEGYISNSQKLFEIISDEFGKVISILFMQSIYVKNALNSKVVKSLLYIMSEVNSNDLREPAAGIIAFALSNKDYEIKDLALQCFEKWKDTQYLDLLKSMDMGVAYLNDYLKHIIDVMEQKR